MYSKLLCIILLYLSFSKKSSVYGLSVKLEDRSRPNSCVGGKSYTDTLHPDTNCKWHISSANRPCSLLLEIVHNLPVNCFWIVDAGLGERVFINSLIYTFTANEGFSYRSKNFPYDDALNVSIYDGNKVNESKRLFKLGDKEFENVISTGSNLTIAVDFKKSDIYKRQFISLQISYLS